MFLRRLGPLAGVVCIALAGVAARADELTGVVAGTGVGKIEIKDRAGSLSQIALSRKDTAYRPDTWRPEDGDTVKVTYAVAKSRRGTVLAASLIELEKAGAKSVVNLKSPVKVTVTEVGRTGIKATIPDGKEIRFVSHRGTVYTPAGWQPAPGEKALVTFRIQQAWIGNGLNYTADAIAKID